MNQVVKDPEYTTELKPIEIDLFWMYYQIFKCLMRIYDLEKRTEITVLSGQNGVVVNTQSGISTGDKNTFELQSQLRNRTDSFRDKPYYFSILCEQGDLLTYYHPFSSIQYFRPK